MKGVGLGGTGGGGGLAGAGAAAAAWLDDDHDALITSTVSLEEPSYRCVAHQSQCEGLRTHSFCQKFYLHCF